MTELLGSLIRGGRLALSTVVATLLAIMMIIIVLDVLGRKFGYPIAFSYEITQITMGLMIYLGLPLVTADRTHVVIDLFLPALNSAIQGVLRAVMDLSCCFLALVVSKQLWEQAQKLQDMTSLFMFTRLPVAPFIFVMSILALITAAVHATLIIAEFGGHRARRNSQRLG